MRLGAGGRSGDGESWVSRKSVEVREVLGLCYDVRCDFVLLCLVLFCFVWLVCARGS